MAYPGKKSRDRQVLEALLEQAELQGFLTADDLLDAVADELGDGLTSLIKELRRRGVEVRLEPVEASAVTDEVAEVGDEPPGYESIPTEDTISLYLKEMALVPLLSMDEEVSLAQRIEQAGEARCQLVQLAGRISLQQARELEMQIQDGFLAREYLIKANTRLVVSIARKYIGRGVPFLDLIQEGNLGLMRAVEKFEYQRGFRFSTYATWWIRQSITRAIADQGRTIRVPVHMTDRLRQVYRASQEMEQELGRAPTSDELASHLGLEGAKMDWMLQVTQIPISLESPVGDDEDAELGMYLEDETTPGPAQVAYQNMLRERVEEVLATLSPREARILRLRFGLGQDRPYTLEEVGQKFGLTRERIRQIEGKALRRLRHPCRARLLREYI